MDEGFGELLAGAKEGREEAVSELHRRYAPRIMAKVRSRLSRSLRRQYDTLDLAQSVFVDVLRDLPRFEDRGEGPFVSWLYLKAENKVRTKLRRHLNGRGERREKTLQGGESVRGREAGPPTTAEGTDLRERALECLALLPSAQRRIVRLRTEERLSFGEIADRLALPSADAARMRYSRALVAVRERWADLR